MKQYWHLVLPGLYLYLFFRAMHTSQVLFSVRMLPFEKVDIGQTFEGERAGLVAERRTDPAVEAVEYPGPTAGGAAVSTPAEWRVGGG